MLKLVKSILDSPANLSRNDSVAVFGEILKAKGEMIIYDNVSHPDCEKLCLQFMNKNSYLYSEKIGLYRSVQPIFIYEIKEEDDTIYTKGFCWKNGYIFTIFHEDEYILYLAIDKTTHKVFGYPDANG